MGKLCVHIRETSTAGIIARLHTKPINICETPLLQPKNRVRTCTAGAVRPHFNATLPRHNSSQQQRLGENNCRLQVQEDKSKRNEYSRVFPHAHLGEEYLEIRIILHPARSRVSPTQRSAPLIPFGGLDVSWSGPEGNEMVQNARQGICG